MFKTKILALAAASALIVSGCATTSWQRPPNHPADPGADPGVVQAITSLGRYRSGAAQTTTPDAKAKEKDQPASDEMDHAGGHQHGESQP